MAAFVGIAREQLRVAEKTLEPGQQESGRRLASDGEPFPACAHSLLEDPAKDVSAGQPGDRIPAAEGMLQCRRDAPSFLGDADTEGEVTALAVHRPENRPH